MRPALRIPPATLITAVLLVATSCGGSESDDAQATTTDGETVPAEQAEQAEPPETLDETLWRKAEPFGICNFGGYAFNSMRMEKMYRAYGNEFTEEISGLEAGMDRFIDTSRDFIGCENLKQRQQDGYAIELAYLLFDDDLACECFGNEAVYHNGDLIGLTTGGAYGHRIGKSIAFAYLKPEQISAGLEVTVDTSSGSRVAHIEMDAAYDPANELLRS